MNSMQLMCKCSTSTSVQWTAPQCWQGFRPNVFDLLTLSVACFDGGSNMKHEYAWWTMRNCASRDSCCLSSRRMQLGPICSWRRALNNQLGEPCLFQGHPAYPRFSLPLSVDPLVHVVHLIYLYANLTRSDLVMSQYLSPFLSALCALSKLLLSLLSTISIELVHSFQKLALSIASHLSCPFYCLFPSTAFVVHIF